jgi:hypothetical protein
MRAMAGLAMLAVMLAGCQTDQDYAPRPSLASPTYGPSATGRPASGSASGGAAANQARARQPSPSASRSPTASIPRSWIPEAPVRDWQYIVVHHSDTSVGSAAAFDRAHRARGWDCLGYDFVIGNGSQTGDGQVEVGQRWTRQMVGAHAGVKLYNEQGIGICLVGNFQDTRPTQAQMQSLAKLTGYLEKTYRIPSSNVIGHRDAKSGGTLCPGRFMDLASVRRMSASYAELDPRLTLDPERLAMGGEMLHDAHR